MSRAMNPVKYLSPLAQTVPCVQQRGVQRRAELYGAGRVIDLFQRHALAGKSLH